MSKNYAVGTKISAMKSGLFGPRDYAELLNAKSVVDIASYLKNRSSYKTVLSNININNVHREELEARMFYAVVNDFIKIMHYYRIDNKKIFSYFIKKLEIEQIKTLLRQIGSQTDFELYVDSLPLDYSFDFAKVASAKDIKSFVEALRGSPYYNVLNQFIVSSEYLNEFAIEMNLDMYYFKYVINLAENEKEGKSLLNTLGREIDVLNLMWIYRCKKYYTMDKSVIYSFIIPHYYKVGSSVLAQMVEAKTIEEVLDIASRTEYSIIFKNENCMFFEQASSRYVNKIFKNNIKYKRFSIIGAISYLHLRETEIKDIVAIVEGVRYKLSPDEVKKYLITEL